MKFIEELLEVLEENKINFFTEEELDERLKRNGYIEKKQKNKKSGRSEPFFENENRGLFEEVDFFRKDELNRALNKKRFKNDRDRKVWYRDEEGKEALGNVYMDKLESIGFDRYCSDDDEYIDEPREKIEDVYLPYGLIEELEGIGQERGLSFGMSLELILLEYLAYRKSSTEKHLNNIIESLERSNYSDEEIKFITNKYKRDKESFVDTDICHYLDEFYLEYFKSLNFTDEQLDVLITKGKEDVEFLEACYYGATHYEKTDFEGLKVFYENDFRETDIYYLERAKNKMEQMGLTDDQIIYLTSQNSDILIEQFSDLVDEYKLKTFEDIEELYRNEFFVTGNLFFKYLEAIEIKENEIELLKSYVNPKMKKEKQESILDRVFRDMKKFKVSEFGVIEKWMKEVFEVEEKAFMEEIARITDEKL